MSKRIALVTGANRGLGAETCRQLRERGYEVIPTARKPAPDGLRLDVTDRASIEQAAEKVRAQHGQLDALVANAGVALDGFDVDVAKRTLAVNVTGARDTFDVFRPLLSDSAAVVMVSSGMGSLSCLKKALQARFEDPALTRDGLSSLMDAFVADVAAGTFRDRGWPGSAYRVSKVGLNALTRIMAAELASTQIRINAVCPGWVRTDMGGAAANRSVEEGAEGIVWAATLSPNGPTGSFFRDGKAISW